MSEKQIITGPTGCGKTYQTIMGQYAENKRFVYLAPCRQLVYESFIEYSKEGDSLSTGEVHKKGTGSLYGVYESVLSNDISEYDSIIIDEAHNLSDNERGPFLSGLVEMASKLGKDIFLLTATNCLRDVDFPEFSFKELKPIVENNLIEIDIDEAYNRVLMGKRSIIFRRSIRECEQMADYLRARGVKAVDITSSVPPGKRLQYQYEFRNGNITTVVATNLLAQGVNFPCENLIIEMSEFNTPELLQQKLGRLGRPFQGDFSELTYATEMIIPDTIPTRDRKKLKKNNKSICYLDVPDGKYSSGSKTITVKDKVVYTDSFQTHQMMPFGLGFWEDMPEDEEDDDFESWSYFFMAFPYSDREMNYCSVRYAGEYLDFLKSSLGCIPGIKKTTTYQQIMRAKHIFGSTCGDMKSVVMKLLQKRIERSIP